MCDMNFHSEKTESITKWVIDLGIPSGKRWLVLAKRSCQWIYGGSEMEQIHGEQKPLLEMLDVCKAGGDEQVLDLLDERNMRSMYHMRPHA